MLKHSFENKKGSLQKSIDLLNGKLKEDEKNANRLCQMLNELDRTVDEFKGTYYDVRRKNYELQCELDFRRGYQ